MNPSTDHRLSDSDYGRLTQDVLAAIEAQADRWLQQDVIDLDTSRHGGMLELSFPDDSRIVINTQPPLQELWLAARQGGYHFRYDGQTWRDTKTGTTFAATLSSCATQQSGRDLTFDV